MLRGEACTINGDGETSRDFCFVANAVQANLRAAYATLAADVPQVYNVAVGDPYIAGSAADPDRPDAGRKEGHCDCAAAEFRPFHVRAMRHHWPNIDKARTQLGFEPTHDVRAGMIEAADWYIASAARHRRLILCLFVLTRQRASGGPASSSRPALCAASMSEPDPFTSSRPCCCIQTLCDALPGLRTVLWACWHGMTKSRRQSDLHLPGARDLPSVLVFPTQNFPWDRTR